MLSTKDERKIGQGTRVIKPTAYKAIGTSGILRIQSSQELLLVSVNSGIYEENKNARLVRPCHHTDCLYIFSFIRELLQHVCDPKR